MSKIVVVRTTCVATVRERFEVLIADDADVNTLSWSGSGGIEEAITLGTAGLLKQDVTHVDDQREYVVTFTREVVPLVDAG